MTLQHPFERVPPGRLRHWFVPVLAGTLASGAGMLWLLDSEAVLVRLFELLTADSIAELERLVAGMTPEERVRIAFLGGFDFLFGALWTTLFAIACIWGSRVFRHPGLTRFGVALAWLAYLLDFPENGAYVSAVHGSGVEALRAVGAPAFWVRVAIFALLDAYLTLAALVWLVRGGWQTRRPDFGTYEQVDET